MLCNIITILFVDELGLVKSKTAKMLQFLPNAIEKHKLRLLYVNISVSNYTIRHFISY